MDKKEKLRVLETLSKKWYHTISLGDGITINGDPGNNKMKWQLIRSRLPKEIKGSVLDLGPAEGYFTVKMLQKGCIQAKCIERCPRMRKKFDFVMDCMGKSFGEKKIVMLLDYEIDDYILQIATQEDVDLYDYSIALAIIHWVNYPVLFMRFLSAVTKKMAFVEIVVNDIDKFAMRTERKKRMFKWHIGGKLFRNMAISMGFKKVIKIGDYMTSFGSHRALYALYK